MKQDIYNIPEGYKNSPLGIIPNEWEVERLGNIVSITSGESPSLYTLTSHGKYPFIKVEDMNNCEKYQIRSREYSNDEKNIIHKESIIFPKRGAAILNNKVRIAKVDIQMDSNMMAIKPNNKVLPEYLFYSITFEQLFRIADTSTIPQINNKHINPYKILLPPLNEQRKIAEVLSTWDKAIEKQTLLIEKLELRKKGLMQQLLTGKKRLPGFSGGAWKKVKLGDIGQCYSGLTNKNKSDFECGAAKFITYMNVFCHGKIDINILGRVNIEADEKQEKVKKGDIFFTVSSETPEEVGMSSVLMDDVNNTYLNSFCFGFRLYNNEILLPKYAIYAFRGTDMRKNMYRIAQGSTRFNLSKDEVMSLKITVPTVQEQNAIAEILSFCDNEITLARQKLDTLRQQKKGLMQVLLTGKKRIKI